MRQKILPEIRFCGKVLSEGDLALRVPPQKRRDMLLGLLYNREHESEKQCQRDALYP
jgi:hypothetical protein